MKYSDNPIADCPYCGLKAFKPKVVQTPNTPHYARLSCPKCGRHVDWMGKPKNKSARPNNKYTPESLNIDFCQICLRPRSMLGKNETLIVHHIHEIQDHGPDVPENILVVCSYCHSDIHSKRTYLYHHFNNEIEPEEESDKLPWE